jgi:UDPglucose 6-dehydrogenase
MHREIVERLKTSIPQGATVAVLGLAYKPFSHVIEESQGVLLAKAISEMGARVLCYDPLAADQARAELAYSALILDSLEDCLSQASYVLITTPDPVFKSLRAEDFTFRPVTVVDFWRLLDCQLKGHAGITYVPWGRSVDDGENAARLSALWDGTWKHLA